VPPAQRSLRRQHNRQLCARASARGVRKLAVSLDKLRLTRDATVGGADDDHVVVNGRAAAAVEVEKLCAVAEAAADRAEMRDIVGRQRDGWNHLLLHSTNSLALAASVMAALAPGAEPTTLLLALKASAGALLATAAVTMVATGKVQPSQLAEEQRNATRLWRQLERDVRAALRQAATAADVVHHAVDRVLALDAAYPLLPQMLDKFPEAVEPTRWWPRRQPRKKPARSPTVVNGRATVRAGNGWTPELEDEMRGIARAIRAKDEAEYVSNAKLALALNRGLAVAGPALARAAALAAAFVGPASGSWASGAAVVGGALAATVNTVEHGAQGHGVRDLPQRRGDVPEDPGGHRGQPRRARRRAQGERRGVPDQGGAAARPERVGPPAV
jgi:hypothetical protein